MLDQLERFVASLSIPDDRKAVVLAELTDHVTCATEAAVRDGKDPEAAARAVLGDLEALRRSLETVEPAFRISKRQAFGRGVIAAVAVAIVIDQLGTRLFGVVGAVAAIAIAATAAPPRVFELLRAELRAPRVASRLGAVSGPPIGPALVYAFTVLSAPFVIWTGMIVARAYTGTLALDVPWSAFSLMSTVIAVLLVEAMRARRGAVA